MIFINDTELSLRATTALVNTLSVTDSDGVDRLESLDDMSAYLTEYGFSGEILHTQKELDAVREIRPRLLQLWHVDRAHAVDVVNHMLVDGHALPQLVRHDHYDWHIHAASADAPLATRILVEAAMAFVDVIRADAYDRVRVCSADDCTSVYIDYSKNGSKRYCDTGNCGNRMNVIAYRRRQAEETA